MSPDPSSERPPERQDPAPRPDDESVGEEAYGAGLDSEIPGAEPRYDYPRMLAGIAIGLAIVAIGVFSMTDLSSVLLPMDDAYLRVLVPPTEDGSFPFVLDELSHDLSENSLSVSGRVTNNSIRDLENVLAVIRVEETTGRFPATLEVPVDPSPLPAGESGRFETSVTLPQQPDEYSVRFKLQNGPFVPHQDQRSGPRQITVPNDGEPIRLNIPNE